VTSYLERFHGGEHEQVWAELGRLDEVPAEQVDDVTAVATETMRRVAGHVRRIADGLAELGFVPGSERIPVHEPPSADDVEDIAVLDEETGGLPIAFAACLREVGGVSFLGDCAALQLYYNERYSPRTMPPGPEYPDPLSLPPANYLRYSWDDFPRGRRGPGGRDEFGFPFAPDELHKANISGSTHVCTCPTAARTRSSTGGRPARRDAGVVPTYLDRWGGFPGWSFAPERAPAALAGLRVEPDF
jgi:hypothetical protein